MLKHIPACISPELMSIMMKMGHGDELVKNTSLTLNISKDLTFINVLKQ